MMVITKKFKMRDILIFALVIVAILAVLLIPGKSPETESTQETKTEISTNEDRIAYLQQLGYEVEQSPLKEREVRIPDAEDPVFTRYNALQLSQGFDLTQYAGKVAKQFVYRILNDPSGDVDLYATILVYDNQVIGGDVASKSASGVMRALIAQQ
ncbi:MAG: DUF4830 domain-containing protein [Oscillospiraceae bacterium]|nr:DUF4830 domain-containing protein [Oscillospiraceae bacterium]